MGRDMLFSRLDLVLKMSLDKMLDRQAVLATNVANVETPGFRSSDLSFEEEIRSLADSSSDRDPAGLVRTDPQHLPGPGEAAGQRLVYSDRPPGVDGNNVDLDRELVKATENALRYQAVVTVLSRRLGILRYAVTEGGR